MLFKKKEPRIITVDGKQIELQPKKKSGGLGSLFAKKPKAPPANAAPGAPITNPVPAPPPSSRQQTAQPQRPNAPQAPQPSLPSDAKAPAAAQAKQEVKRPSLGKPSAWRRHIQKIELKNRKLETLLKQHGIKQGIYEFIQRMIIAAIIVAVVVAATLLVLLLHLNLNPIAAVVIAAALGFAIYQYSFHSFLGFPLRKEAKSSKNIERDILFASRDLIISLRSGMPLYNAIASVSTGYGDASREFAKITERAQLGMSLEEAIDQTIAESKSSSFRRLMLQASVSIKAGADVVGSLQSIIDQLSEERVIALRRYGQRLNAIAMFYMLFGVILPSMGIAIGTILTTFISIFTINVAVLEAGLVALLFLQIIFLQMIRSSRPVFAM